MIGGTTQQCPLSPDISSRSLKRSELNTSRDGVLPEPEYINELPSYPYTDVLRFYDQATPIKLDIWHMCMEYRGVRGHEQSRVRDVIFGSIVCYSTHYFKKKRIKIPFSFFPMVIISNINQIILCWV